MLKHLLVGLKRMVADLIIPSLLKSKFPEAVSAKFRPEKLEKRMPYSGLGGRFRVVFRDFSRNAILTLPFKAGSGYFG